MNRHALVLALTSAVFATACGSASFEVSFGGGTGSVEDAAVFLIERDIAEQLGEPLTADCPEVADPEVGVTFTCTATTDDGLRIDFDGIVDREDHIDVQTNNLIVADRVPEWAALAEDSITETVGFDVTVECGDRFVVLDDEAGMTCTAIDPDGVTAELRITNVDLDAVTFDWFIEGDG